MDLNVPKHIAIIMDGNGRWAQEKGKSRFYGHYAGAEVVEPVTLKAKELGVSYITLFAFSTENWKRPKEEIDVLFKLFKEYLIRKEESILKNGIKMKFIGRKDRIPEELLQYMEDIEQKTRENSSITLTLAVDYGGLDDITRAFSKLLKEKNEVNQEDIKKALDTCFLPAVDLLIRTGNEKRISNFLLWDIAYAEIFFCEKYWPDFTPEDLCMIVEDFSKRKRRFGAVQPVDMI
ncbi:polyprenyl diphosphate synthase [Hydrogenobaculum sp.]|nr:MAG: di-trans,poly-cis-decaprenylcistransferase [Hydrogenobaculum sp.]